VFPDGASTDSHEEELHRVLAECLDSIERGLPFHAAGFAARHPEFADQIQEFFAGHQWLTRLTAPIRELLKVESTGDMFRPVATLLASLAGPPESCH
jgi:hypothetical protein